jgi:hypothetical protein
VNAPSSSPQAVRHLALYRQILMTVIQTITRKGRTGAIRRFSVYFLRSVQEHMKHHGEGYYYQAKAAQRVADVLPSITRQVRSGSADPTDVLSQINRVVRSQGGRRRRAIHESDSGDLFNHCKGSAKPRHNARNHSQTFAELPVVGSETLKPPPRTARDS